MIGEQGLRRAVAGLLQTEAAATSPVVIVDDHPANVAILERLPADADTVRGFTDPRRDCSVPLRRGSLSLT